jgi:N-sulfoglucosamine sulfohydrolase
MASSPTKRNVLFIIADDWSPIAACYGNSVIQTPRIDVAAKTGIVFDFAFCTTPSCAASRASILTGQHSHTHGQYGHCHGAHGFRTHSWMPSTVSLLRQAGYATACIGKKHVAPESVYPFEFEPKFSPPEERSPAAYETFTRNFLTEIGDRSFYCHVGIQDPHRSQDASLFGNSEVAADAGIIKYRPEDVTVPPVLPDLPEVRQELAEYYQAISRFDETVGKVLDALQESGHAEDTLVFITSDHGMPFPGAKASSSEFGHHCPLIVLDPTSTGEGRRCPALVNWTEYLPTILDWCGVEAPGGLPGRSMLPLFSDPNQSGWDETFYAHNFHEITNYYPYRVLRGRRYKYVLNLANEFRHPLPSDLYRSVTWQTVLAQKVEMLGGRPRDYFLYQPREALYDLESEPTEANNLIEHPEFQDMLNAMRTKMHTFRFDTKDPWLELSMQQAGPDFVDIGQTINPIFG